MLAQDRYKKIIEILAAQRSVKVSHLIELFGVSIETVRRDLEYLEKEGCLKRVYGGAVLEKLNTSLIDLDIRKNENMSEKKEIASLVVKQLIEGQSVGLDIGTTTLEIARAIKNNFQKMTIVTNSLLIANELSDMNRFDVILCGGIFKSDEQSLVGEMAKENIGKFHIDTCVIAFSGVSIEAGFTDYRYDEIQIQKKFIEVSNKVLMVGTSNKFNTSALLKICDLGKADVVITDSRLNEAIRKQYEDNGVKIINK